MAGFFTPEVINMKAQCWRSPWKVIERDENGRATRFVMLAVDEMARAFALGRVEIPESALRRG